MENQVFSSQITRSELVEYTVSNKIKSIEKERSDWEESEGVKINSLEEDLKVVQKSLDKLIESLLEGYLENQVYDKVKALFPDTNIQLKVLDYFFIHRDILAFSNPRFIFMRGIDRDYDKVTLTKDSTISVFIIKVDKEVKSKVSIDVKKDSHITYELTPLMSTSLGQIDVKLNIEDPKLEDLVNKELSLKSQIKKLKDHRVTFQYRIDTVKSNKDLIKNNLIETALNSTEEGKIVLSQLASIDLEANSKLLKG